MAESPVLETFALGQPWTCFDPFIFTVHHLDEYPEGNANQGISPQNLGGRNIGSDFSYRDGWSMYHGSEVPGFPQHPHRGFETVTVQQRGFTDHSDSLGATARYGEGDTQWLTAGSGIMHSEMFPLIKSVTDESVLVPEDVVKTMVRRLALEDKMVVEGSGALAVAAAQEIPRAERGVSVCLVTGGSIDRDKLVSIL